MRPHVSVLVMLAFAGCKKHERSGDPTVDWFRDHREQFEKVQGMLAADRGNVTSIGLGFASSIHEAGNAKLHCSSQLRGGQFPWTCSDGSTVANLGELETRLGLAHGRLEAYARVLPARGLDSDDRCAAPGAIKFWVEDPDSSPCTGTENIVWSSTPPQWNPERCPRTVETHYVPLGGNWYADECVKKTK